MQTLYRLAGKIRNYFLRLVPNKTFGSRALVIQGDKILLVKHSYQRGWYTIGGAVESGESPLQGIIRELYEEAGIAPKSSPKLLGVYLNTFEKRNDYVALYLVHDFVMEEVYSPEILEKQWFELARLPEDVTPATRRRIEEYQGLRQQSDTW